MTTPKRKVFILTSEHLKLLARLCVDFTDEENRDDCDVLGAPSIDSKRPYGNAPAYRDINEILGLGFIRDEDGEFSEKERAYMLKFHKETGTALQTVLSTGQFKPGIYETEELAEDTGLYSREWENTNHNH